MHSVWRRLLELDDRTVLESIEFDRDAEVVIASVGPKVWAKRRCGRCGRRSLGYDHGEGRRRWRGLDLGTVRLLLEAEAPRVVCRDHGVVVAQVPWTRNVMSRLNPHFENFAVPVASLSGGQRQSVAIARAVEFNARVLIMDEPTAALGPAESEQVRDLIRRLRGEGIGIFLISHDIHDVYDLADRITVMLQGEHVGTVNKTDVTIDQVLAMIILGKHSEDITESDIEGLH